MAVGVLIISHNRVGATLLETATTTMQRKPLATQLLPIAREHDPELVFKRGQQLVQTLETGDGVLICTDAYGSTPSNIATRLLRECNGNIRVVAGLNLPMLLTLFNYAKLDLPKLAEKVVEAGQRGIIHVEA